MKQSLAELLGIRYPIVQAPLGGVAANAKLVAAVSQAGGLGSLGAAYMTPEQIEKTTLEIRTLTDQPFAINLFAPQANSFEFTPEEMQAMLEHLRLFHTELGIAAPQVPQKFCESFEEQLEVVLRVRPALFSFTFGIPPTEALEALKARGIKLAGTATTVQEARLLEAAGVDAVVVQGSEAGGHRGTFAISFEQAMIGTMALVPQVAQAVSVAVIASGGIMNGQGIRAAMLLGAAGAALGTAFMVCDEAGIPEAYRQAILQASDDSTDLIRAFSGRPARGIGNRFSQTGPEPLPFPVQNALTRTMRSAASQQGRAELLSLWAGQAAHMARPMPAAELMRLLIEEMEAGG